jgi:hypothetical protein
MCQRLKGRSFAGQPGGLEAFMPGLLLGGVFPPSARLVPCHGSSGSIKGGGIRFILVGVLECMRAGLTQGFESPSIEAASGREPNGNRCWRHYAPQ